MAHHGRLMAANSSIDWQVEKKTNADRAKFLLETSLYCDCQFLVGNEDDKQVSFH